MRWLKVSTHPIFMRMSHGSSAMSSVDSLRLLHSFVLFQLPRCGGQIPCVLPLRTLASWPRTGQRPLHHRGLCRIYPGVLGRAAVPHRRSLMRAEDEPITLKKGCRPVCRRQSVSHDRTGRPVVCSLCSQVSSVQETQRHTSESEQIRTLLERRREQILADCQAEIQKHEFQADYDRRSIQKFNEINHRVSKRRNLSCSSRRRTTSTR